MRIRRILSAAAVALLLTGAAAGTTAAQDSEPPATVEPAAGGGFESWFVSTPITVNGTYEPFLGGRFCSEYDEGLITGMTFWYAPGPAADHL